MLRHRRGIKTKDGDMSMRINRQRPFFLNLMAIRLPIGGIVSILHRASGAALSVAVPCLLYALSLSLQSPEDYADIAGFFSGGLGWLLGLGLLWALLHHFLAGLRHLGFDFGLGEEKARARQTAWLALGVAIAVVGLIGLMTLKGGGA
jgi:succinate dehydrogenase / fumarate reductase, cytochrome b subunit